MSCNGCRVLRKGCSEDCMLRHCLMWIQNPQSQAHATVFVAKFFGRATLMSFLSSVPTNQRSELFQSLLYEAVGRTINPVNGAVGMLWSTGNWHLCQLAVEQVLRGGGGALTPLPHFSTSTDHHEAAFEEDYYFSSNNHQDTLIKRKVQGSDDDDDDGTIKGQQQAKKQRAGMLNEDDYSETATFGTSSSKEYYCASQSETKLLTLFL